MFFDDRFFAERTLDGGDEIAECGGLAFAEIEDVAELAFVGEAGGHALDDVVYVGVVAARGAVAELLDTAPFVDGLRERMDGEVGALARAIDGEKAEVDRAEAEEVGKIRADLLGGEFRGGVGRDGLCEREVFAEGERFQHAIHAAAARADEARDVAGARGFEEVQRAEDVRLDVKARVFDRGPHARTRGEMHDAVETPVFHDAEHGVGVADVGLVDGCVLCKTGDVGALDCRVVEIIEIIHDGDRMAEGEAFFYEVRADESGTAGHEDFHAVTLLADRGRGQGGVCVGRERERHFHRKPR